jgi:hypothetical protein
MMMSCNACSYIPYSNRTELHPAYLMSETSQLYNCDVQFILLCATSGVVLWDLSTCVCGVDAVNCDYWRNGRRMVVSSYYI